MGGVNMISSKHLLDACEAKPHMLHSLARDPHVQSEFHLRQADVQPTGVHCPVVDEEIVVPCSLKSCVYYTDTSRCHHCALVYVQQRDEVDVDDLALLYRKSARDMQVTMASILRKVKGLLEEPAARYVPLEGVCVACEAPIEDAPYTQSGYAYCHETCCATFPPANVRAGYIPTVGDRHERD